MWEKMLFIILKKEFFRIKVIYTEKSEDKSEDQSEKKRVKKCIEYIEKESKGLNCNLFKCYFKFSVPSALVKELFEKKKINKSNKLVNVIKSELSD